MATAIDNRPADTLRERGGLKATIWKNTNSSGRAFYSVEFSRTYKTEKGYAETRSFRDSDLLVLAHLASKAYDRIGQLRAQDADNAAEAV